MKAQSYFLATGVIFAAIAIMHVLRIVNGWPFTMGSVSVPMWVSVLGVIIPGSLSIWAFKLNGS